MYSVSTHRLRTDAQLMGNNTLHATLIGRAVHAGASRRTLGSANRSQGAVSIMYPPYLTAQVL